MHTIYVYTRFNFHLVVIIFRFYECVLQFHNIIILYVLGFDLLALRQKCFFYLNIYFFVCFFLYSSHS